MQVDVIRADPPGRHPAYERFAHRFCVTVPKKNSASPIATARHARDADGEYLEQRQEQYARLTPCAMHRSRVSSTPEEGKGSVGFHDRVARCGDEG